MSYYDEYDDFYDYPSEFQQQIDDFKAALLKSVRQEFLDKMEGLREENESLREFRDDKERYDRELRRIKAEYERKAVEATRQAEQKRLKDLMVNFAVIGYRPEFEYIQRPKCDKCDSNRKIHFVSPMGRQMSEDCECAYKDRVSRVVQATLYKFNTNNPSFCSVYYTRNEDDWYSAWDEVYKNGTLPQDVSRPYYAVFLSKDDCQAYCDWWNERERNGQNA